MGSKYNYYLNKDGVFVIENYNLAPTFSSFFPGIAGVKGIPMWAYYVNRGQSISTFGIKNKNYAIMEFYPANNTYTLVSTFGFRTFFKIKKSKEVICYEPFKNNSNDIENIKQNMYISSSELTIEEINKTIGIKTIVKYFTLPNQPLAGLLRTVTVENISRADISIEIIDGMPKVLPYYTNVYAQKNMSTTIQAWATVDNFDKTGVPFYRLKVEVEDRPEVVEITEGNFYYAFTQDKQVKKADIIIDPDMLFGADNSFIYPENLFNGDFKYPKSQFASNKYPSAFSYIKQNLKSSKQVTIYSMVGHIESVESLNKYIKKLDAKYFNSKQQENKNLIDSITDNMATKSAMPEFDMYCRQNYLDNVMRGGLPIEFNYNDKTSIYYVFSRKHGDLERDYNDFQVSPSYYSQGNGNYRDVNQNRRKDIFFNPKLEDSAVKIFYNLMQIDGGNPLVVKGTYYVLDIKSNQFKDIVKDLNSKQDEDKLKVFFSNGFEPGQLAMFLESSKIKTKSKIEDFISKIVTSSQSVNDASHGEGYWVDHWTYNLDLVESYLSIYPEKMNDLIFKDKTYIYYDSDHYVLPRCRKHVLTADGSVRQYGSVTKSEEKEALIKTRKINPNALRTKNGKGDIYTTTLASKFITLMTVKFSSLDPDGIGIEMESDKPGWYDSLNGLPGLFGSSTPEVFELKRLMLFFENILKENKNEKTFVPVEVAVLFKGLSKLLDKKLESFDFWDMATTLREDYRKSVIFGINGKEEEIKLDDILDFIKKAVAKMNIGLKKAIDKKSNLYFTYFRYEAVKYQKNNEKSIKGLPCVKVSKFVRNPLPLFLESEVHYPKTENNKENVKQHLLSMKKTGLYDKELKMYKVCDSLLKESNEIGRTRVFLPGWLENEAIFMHMEYKYILGLLKAGLYDDFFNELKNCNPCFMKPEIYGRSILENSSFISSSAFPDKRNWGRGFVARLSGSTAEFIDMWITIVLGKKPFTIDSKNNLIFKLNPIIHSSYFDKDGKFSAKLFSTTDIIYVNKSKKSTYSPEVQIKKIEIVWNSGKKDIIDGCEVIGQFAQDIRNRQAKSITVIF
ncbi:MAG: hypothetical protein PHT81_04180 [Endomicrobiaceae bacterium]|nr:hypothetical protein [Endomicrobiaceae bacterium]